MLALDFKGQIDAIDDLKTLKQLIHAILAEKSDTYTDELEVMHFNDLELIDQLNNKLKESKEQQIIQNNLVLKLKTDSEQAKADYIQTKNDNIQLTNDRKRLAAEKTQLLLKINTKPKENIIQQPLAVQYVDSSAIKNQQLEIKVEQLTDQLTETQNMLEECRQYQLENDQLNSLLRDTNLNLDTCRDHIALLESKLALQASGLEPEVESKSLLGK